MIAAFCAAFVAAVISPSASPSTSFSPPAGLTLKLTTSKTIYYSGEPVMVKIDVVNTSRSVTSVLNLTPWDATTLTIVRDGKAVPPAHPPVPYSWMSPYATKLRPGNALTLRWQRDLNPITYWGYAPLEPGHYILTIAPKNFSASGSSVEIDVMQIK